ncbi:M48 family metalloprotease [Teredinibacter sp. KSP-S5-2]|uniref:M48 family metalloprotease n=1 Tax=Teredinibacter sp. KSP-S5-2 TaxID=3034506 RepID=UPI002934F5D2|nr:M48 family metalloprotease [Teredinibacter sp. KSP-S5-2]WNO09844.1 M48 family metalloprotease [Teredinibacter sp. KSP-S5-2]
MGHSIRFFILWLLPVFTLLSLPVSSSTEVELPDLGQSGGGMLTLAQEYELGQKWLRVYRSHIPTSTDPFLQDYVEQTILNLARYSALEDKRLDVLVIENPAINAFAVPGGVIGVHTGLFKYAENQYQFSSVLAHELAHLSQRHYSRRLEAQKDAQIPTLAAIIASILLSATAGGDAGIAAISATQAAAMSNQLSFSRQMEREADRVGMETLVRSGADPSAMPDMFEEMLKITRYQRRPPEFLLTHPVTESRVTDSKLRAQKYQTQPQFASLEYLLLKARTNLLHEHNPHKAVRIFESMLESKVTPVEPAKYGLALAYTRTREFAKAQELLTELLKGDSKNFFYIIAQSKLWSEEEQFQKAVKPLEALLKDYPRNHPLNVSLAEIYMQAGKYEQCQQLLERHVERRPKDDYVWYLLAEVHGLAGDILEVHRARAEYFMLNGLPDKAEIQLKNALKLVDSDKYTRAKIEQRLKDARDMKKDMEGN